MHKSAGEIKRRIKEAKEGGRREKARLHKQVRARGCTCENESRALKKSASERASVAETEIKRGGAGELDQRRYENWMKRAEKRKTEEKKRGEKRGDGREVVGKKM